MRVRMDLLIHLWVCKVLWVRNVLGDVGNETHVFDIILDEVVVLSAVLTSLEGKPFDHSVVVHVGLH